MNCAKSYTAPFYQAKKEGLLNHVSTSGKIGPGSYRNMDPDISSKKSKVRGGVITSSRKFEESKIGNPSPSQYNPLIESIKPSNHNGSIGRASIQDRGEIVPYGKLNGFHLNLNNISNVGPASYSARIDSIK